MWVREAGLEVAGTRQVRAALRLGAAVARIEPLGNVFRGVFCPAALLIARRELDPARRLGERVWTPRGERLQAEVMRDPELKLHPPLTAADRALLERLQRRAGRLARRGNLFPCRG